nr:hypothetical protein [Tanacetum cinerariifolium]
MPWFSRCSWCGGPFNSGNFRHCTNVSFGDEPVCECNPSSYNQTPDFSNSLPHHNYEADSRSDTGATLQAEFTKLQQNFELFMAQQSCSYCGGPFNGGNYPSYSIVGAKNEFVHAPNPFLYDNTPDFYDQPPQNHVETYSCKLCGNDFHYGYDCPPWFPLVYKQEPSYDQNFDIISQLSPSIVITTSPPVLSIEDPEDSLIVWNEELSTILEKESDEVIKSSVDDFVPIPSESEDTSGSDSECVLPLCDDFSPINVPEGKSVTFSNPLFDSNDDFTSSDDESFSNKDVSENNVKIYSNPLFEFDDEYIFITPLFNSNEDECFDPGGDADEINAFDIPSDFKDGYYESEGDALYLESFLSDDTTSNPLPEVFLDRGPKSLSDINDLKIMVKVFDPEIPYGESNVHIEVLSVL